ncbi:hypothetical protein VMCG_02163 [Cytospora schulzeri]|uniref:SMP-30/Gluconolactonase/LRE-like region domain-containing protein n=1 Tax=Cytospora schulzeri TaxID=448051 RepID=A0A423X237_9PEZI|nr:hypothetical protein VMCG_02163 [Valsa malicola]
MTWLTKIGLGAIVLIAVLIQLPIAQRTVALVRLGLAIGKTIQPISDFAHTYQCRRIVDPWLEACEDMWLSEATRKLYLACSDPEARDQWMPNEGQLNLTGRSTRDAIIMMDLETLDFSKLPMPGFPGTQGDGIINFNGFTGADREDGCVDLFITNFRPSIDTFTGLVLPDQAAVGGNSTIEVFKTCPKADSLEHVRTIADRAVVTPNRVAVTEGGGLYLTNDHGQHKIGWRNLVSPILLTGDVTYCPDDASAACQTVSEGYGYPNGLITSHLDGLVYVPRSAQGGITVLRPRKDQSLEFVDEINIPYAIDNLSEDRNGVIWAAVIPNAIQFMRQAKDPRHQSPSSSVFKIFRTEKGLYEVVKVLEDRHGQVLPGTTTVVHDVTTARLFLSGRRKELTQYPNLLK